MFSFGWLDPSSLAWWLPSAYAAFVGIFYAYVWLRWGRREQRGRKGKSSKAEAGATSLREPLLNADVLADEEEEEEANGGDWADVEQLHIPAGSASGQPQQPLAATGMLWITQSLSYAIFLFRGVEAALSVAGVVESCSICNAALALAWLTMILCRSADHWSRARSPPPPPQRLKMNIWLWPFYNLSFVLSLVSLLSDRHAISLADTGMLAVVAEGLCLLSVSASLLRGADVQWLEDPLNEEFQAGLASAAFFDWFTEYVMKGQRKQLDLEDLPQQMSLDRTKAVWSKFSSSAASKPLLLRLFLLVRPLVIAQGAWQFIAVITELTGPLAMQNIVNFISEYKHGDSVPASVNFFVSLLLLGPLVQGVADGRNFHLGRRIGCRVRSALVNAIFLKTLKTDMSASTYSSGELVNLMSVDAQSALEMAPYMHYIWTTALQIAVCIGLLFYVLGVASLGGVAFMIISIPVGKWTASRQQSYQKQLMSKKDARMGVVGETLQGMRIVKLFAWESYFLRQVEEKRRDEMYVLRRYLIMMAGVIVQWNSVTTLVGLCTFVVHTRVLGRSLSASQGFTALSLFNILRFPLLVLPDVFNFLFQSYVSLKRVESFLGRNEIEGLAEEGGAAQSTPLGMLPGSVSVADASFSWGHPPPAASSTEAAAEPAVDSSKPPGQQTNGAQAASAPTDDVEVAWPLLYDDSGSPTSSASSSAVSDEAGSSSPTVSSPESGKITLTDINLEAGPGQLLCIYGVTGGGKSSLLLGILGEIRKLKGSVNLCGSIAYCSQRAWIQNATVRDNILFGLPFEQDHYTRVIRACALESDLELLEHGDETEIGEKGINLSGGQQQRVSLARALYSNADIYLLDDVLSAVDAHVGEHIFRKCIRHELLRRGKTVILVSHSIALTAKHADQAVIIERGGKIAESGPPTKLLEDPDSMLSLLVQKLGGGGGDRLMRQSSNVVDDLQTLLEAPDKEGGGKSIASKLIKEEERAKGAPGLGIYRAYVAACGGPISFLAPYLVLHVSYNAMAFAQNLSLSNWVTVLEDDKPDGRAMWTYIIVSFAVIVAIFGRSLFQSLASLKASVHLHDSMAARIMRAPMGWFETTPTGRILNRFASDMQEIDKNAMEEFGSTLACFFSVASIVLVISYTAPYLIIGLVPVSALSWFIGQLYLNASRELKRLDSVSKSPIYSHFTESVNGVSTIRAFGAQKRFVAESGRRVDCCNRAHFNLWVANRWFNIVSLWGIWA
jgi:ABC-type multidrug transport system fused ATPase/permease subunit